MYMYAVGANLSPVYRLCLQPDCEIQLSSWVLFSSVLPSSVLSSSVLSSSVLSSSVLPNSVLSSSVLSAVAVQLQLFASVCTGSPPRWSESEHPHLISTPDGSQPASCGGDVATNTRHSATEWRSESEAEQQHITLSQRESGWTSRKHFLTLTPTFYNIL